MELSLQKLLIFFICSLTIGLTTIAAQGATINGRIQDSDSGEGVIGAVVKLSGTSFFAVTDTTGAYEIQNVPAGKYHLIITCLGYENSSSQLVEVSSDDIEVKANVRLHSSTTQLSEITVVGVQNKETELSARSFEKNAPNVINVVSASTIESLPDLNVADVMQRVSGVSMLKNSSGANSQMVIRGMPPRYNLTLVNGVAMPTTGASGSSLSLDVFDSNLFGRIEVIKVPTPDMEGDAIGGIVNLIMKEAPDTSFLKANVSTGYNQYNFGHQFLTFDTKAVMAKDFNEQKGPDYVPGISEFGRQNLIVRQEQAPPDYSAEVSAGTTFLHDKLRLMVAGGMQNLSQTSTNNYIDYSSAPDNSLLVNFWENQLYCKIQRRYSGYAKLDYHINPNNYISLYGSVFQLNETRAREVIDTLNEDNRTEPGTGTVHSYNQTITDNSGVVSTVLTGNHKVLKNLRIDWTATYAGANSHSPDYASVFLTQTIPTPGVTTPKYLNYTNAFTRLWQWDIDQNESVYLNLTYNPIVLNHQIVFKVGGMGRSKFRKNYANEYIFNATDQNANYPNPDILTVPVSTRNDQQLQGNAINNPGNYRAWEDVQAGYAMLSTNFGRLQVLSGVRMEFTYMRNEHNQNNPQVPVARARFSYQDLLPSVHLTYRLTDQQNIRASWYEAINRPSYTEVIPYQDIRPGGTIGNPKLSHATASGYDLRYEIYPSGKDVFTLGAFYKKINNAIEELVKSGSETRSFQNVPLVTNYGLEAVVMKYVGRFSFGANYTYTHSIITVPKHFNIVNSDASVTTITRNETRPLVGQSPHLVNIDVRYASAQDRWKFAVAYTMQGSHVTNVSDAYGKDEYQRNYHNMGATLEHTLGSKLALTAKVSNLLNYPIKFYSKDGYFIEELHNYQDYLIGLKLSI